jgi:hypothetical protein
VVDTESGATCSPSEEPINWNQVGLPAAYFHQDPPGAPVVLNPSDGWRVMASLSVPAGTYVVTAKTTVDVVNFVPRSRIDCAVLADTTTIDVAAVTVPADSQAVEALSTGAELSSAASIVFRCRADPTKGMASLYSSSLTAIKVGSLQAQ